MPNLYNVISDIESTIVPDAKLSYEVQHRGEDRWIVYVRIPNGRRSAKLEFLINETLEGTDVAGSVLHYGSIRRNLVRLIMDTITERL